MPANPEIALGATTGIKSLGALIDAFKFAYKKCCRRSTRRFNKRPVVAELTGKEENRRPSLDKV